MKVTKANERHSIKIAEQVIDAKLGRVNNDILYLARHSNLQLWLNSGQIAAKERFTTDLLTFIRHHELYDQIRFLDEHGQEVIRVNLEKGRARIVPDNELQSKAHRYYVAETLALTEGAIYTSPFDLNMEHGIIQQPIKPVLRVATPVVDASGQSRGLVIVNYLGRQLLDRLRAISGQNNHAMWLLNAQGYWLLGPQADLEWGFMYPDRQNLQFEKKFGTAWEKIQSNPKGGQWLDDQGLFTYSSISLSKTKIGLDLNRWILLSYVSVVTTRGEAVTYKYNIGIVFIILAMLLMPLAAIIVHHSTRRQQAEANIRGLLEFAPDAIVITDRNERISLINHQTEEWFGYSRDELLGVKADILLPARYRQRQYFAEPLTRSMGESIELFCLRKDGSEFPVEISLSQAIAGQDLQFTSIIRDITNRKQAEDAKQAVEARYRDLVNNLPVGVYRTTTDNNEGRLLDINPAMLDIFEADSNEQLLALNTSDLYWTSSDRQSLIYKLIQRGKVQGEELQLKTLKNRRFYATVTAVKKVASDGAIYIDGIVEDISSRKENELHIKKLNDNLRKYSTDLEAINKELEAFSYSVSHDLRAPLRAMDGFSHSLLQEYSDRLDDKGKDRLGRIRTAAQHMALLIDDLLTLSRVTRAELKRESVDLVEIAKEIITRLRQQQPKRRVKFSAPSKLMTYSDPRLVRIVMNNLLDNAWKFSGQSNLALIEVGCKNSIDDPIYFIRDNGAGFDMAYSDKLFGAFQRLHDNREFPGTGIGLATVQRVIHKHGGNIWGEGIIGEGATFSFTLGQGQTDER